MAQKNLNKLYPFIDGGTDSKKFGLGKLSFIPTDTEPTVKEGVLYFDDSENKFKMCTDGSTWTAIQAASATGTGLDEGYDINPNIAVDGSAIVLTGAALDVLQIASAGNTGSDSSLLDLVWTGTPNAGGNMIRLDASGATTTGNPFAIELVGTGETMGFAYVDCDPDEQHALHMYTDANGGSGYAQIAIENDGTPHALSNLLLLDSSGATATNTPYSMKINNAGVDIAALYIDTDAATDDGVYITGGGATADNKSLVDLVWDGAPANAGANMLRLDATGVTATNKPVLMEILGGGKTVRALEIDADIADSNVVLINGGGNLADGHAVVSITADGASQTAGGMVLELTNTGTPDTDSRILEIIAGGKDVRPVYIDTASATQDGVYVLNDGNLAANKAAVHIDINNDMDADANALLVDGVGASTTNTPYLVKFDTNTSDMGALYVDADNVTDHTVHLHCGGALANDKAVLNLSIDGTPAVGVANYLRIDASGATSTNVPAGIEIVGAGETMQGIVVDTDITSKHANLFHCGGALTNGLGVVGITNDGDLAAGGNLLNVTMGGTPADATVCAVEIVAAKDCLALDIASSAAATHCAQIIGSGATADNMAVLNLEWGAIAPANAGANILRIDGTSATMTNKPVLCEILDDSISVGLSVSTATIEDMVTLIGTGATGSDKAVLDVTSTATLNVGGNLVRIDGSGATTTSKPVLLEVLDDSVSTAATFTSLPTANNVVTVAAGGAMTNGYAGLMVTSSGALATGGAASAIVISGSPTNASMALEIDAQKDMRAVYIDTDAATNNACEITAGGVIAAGKAALAITNTGAPADGSYLLDITSGAAFASSTTSYLVHLDAAHAQVEALHVDAGNVLFDENFEVTGTTICTGQITAPAGVQGILGTAANLTDVTPTDAEFSTAFGVGNKTKGGFTGVVEDNDSNVAYLVVSDGTTWHFALLTAAGA